MVNIITKMNEIFEEGYDVYDYYTEDTEEYDTWQACWQYAQREDSDM